MASKIWSECNKLTESKDDRVAVYVGTYGKYNGGSIAGKWMYPGDYDSRDEFIEACYELHSDEDDPELMIQDCENLPDSLYSESGFSEEAFEFAKWVDEPHNDIDAAMAYIDIFGNWDENDFEERYLGEFNSMEDYCWNYISECGGIAEAVRNPENYFDFSHFGHELKWDMDEEEDAYYLEMDDYDCGENWIYDLYGSIEGFAKDNPETVENYFDIRQYARDASYDVSEDNGYFFSNY